MRAAAKSIVLASLLCATVQSTAFAQDDGWVQAFSTLRMRPGFADPRATLADRLALAHALGRYGQEADAVATLREALQDDPPRALRDELLLALARRASPAARTELIAQLDGAVSAPPSLALALAALNDPQTIDALVRGLARAAGAEIAQESLLRIGAPAAPRLARALATPVLALRAANVLAGLGSHAQAARPALEHALAARDPALRAAAAGALGALGDPRSAAVLAALLSDQPNVAQAALAALTRVAGAAQAEPIAQLLSRVPAEQKALGLRALASADPARAAPLLASAARAPDAAQRSAALDVLQGDAPDAAWTELLAARVRDEHSEAAASALARIPDGGGMPALLAAARKDANGAATCARALAIGLRRFGAELDAELREATLALLRALPNAERSLVLRALARDPEVHDDVARALHAASASERASAATAARMLGDRELAGPVRDALLRERDRDAVRRLCEAALALSVQLPEASLQLWLDDPETAPEAAALATANAGEQPALSLRVALRRMLAPGQLTRVRVGAAHALGALHDARAWPVLAAALDDPAARVRLAAARALAAIGGAPAAQALRVQARIERDPLVRAAALDGAAPALPAVSGTAPALRGGAATPLVLEARVRTEAAEAHERPLLDVLLDDGRWLRMRTLPAGELILEDLPAGQADVRAVP